MKAPTPRNLTPWHALAGATLVFVSLTWEVAAQAPDPSSNPVPARVSTEAPAPAKPKLQQGRVEGTVTFSWAAGGNPSSPMNAPVDPGGRFRRPAEISSYPRPSFSTVTIVAYPLKADPSLQEPIPRNARAPVATALPDFNGRFSMALDPGEYEIVAISETRPGRIDRVPTRSSRVRIESGKTERCLLSF